MAARVFDDVDVERFEGFTVFCFQNRHSSVQRMIQVSSAQEHVSSSSVKDEQMAKTNGVVTPAVTLADTPSM